MNWNYIAGFFDGEGSVVIQKNRAKYLRIIITVPNTDLNVLQEMKEFTNLGNIYKVTKRQEHWKDAWVWIIQRRFEVIHFIDTIKKYTLVKKEKLIKAKKEMSNYKWRTTFEDKEIQSKIEKFAKECPSKSLREIGREIGISHETIRKYLHKLDVYDIWINNKKSG